MHMFNRPKEHATPTEQKQPAYTESLVDSADGSPPLTSSLHPRHSASSAREQSYLRQASILQWARLALAILVTAAGTAILGCLAHVLKHYNATSNNATSYLFLSMWPINIDLRPTLATLIPAGVVTFGALSYTALAIIPSPHSRHVMQNIFFGITSSIGAIVALFATIYDQTVTYHSDISRDTLLTWTCNLYNSAASFIKDGNKLQLPVSSASTDLLVPAGYKRLCYENEVGRWMMVALLVIELVCVAVAVIGLVQGRMIAKVRKDRYAGKLDEKSSFT